EGFFGYWQEKAGDAAGTAARSLVESVVHAVLFLLCFLLLLILLRLLTKLLDHLFELPVLHALNTLGGGVFALLEAAILLYLVLWLAPEFGITFFRDNASDTYLLKFFTTHTPFTLIAIIASLNGGN
ncbi:MAG: CvpA family protein, partial [Oscillospiraceae bacterium]|nr:CvpA family protein [Oscillospiraceae bacterium]MDY5735883.1 CvpA family protein [Oscillospiraceae bacterium]